MAITGIEALTHGDDGREVLPGTEADWRNWVSPTRTRNFALDDPLTDWLEEHGEAQGYLPDAALPGYDARTDFGPFIMQQGDRFERAVLAHLTTLAPVHTVDRERGAAGSRDLDAARATFEAMRRGERVIAGGVLRDAERRVYGAPDLLVRSDELRRLFPAAISAAEAAAPAPDLGGAPWHYRVVDLKFATLHFRADGDLSETQGSTWAYMVQVYLYSVALGRLQGCTPPAAYLLGRGWERTRKGETERGSSCLDRLGAVPLDFVSNTRGALAQVAQQGCDWVRRVRHEGAAWTPLPEPTVPQLRASAAGPDHGWHTAQSRIAREQQDVALLWNVGPAKRREALAAGITRWTDPTLTPARVGVAGPVTAPTLQAMLDVNRDAAGPPVRPPHVTAAAERWRPEPPLEFYVDFETVSDLADDCARIPQKGGQPLIFMIGCGHIEDGAWRFACFVADALDEPAEARAIDAWFAHMAAARVRRSPAVEPWVLHWSHAERSMLESAYNSARERHPGNGWPAVRWFDFLKDVVKAQPVVTRGALGFGLKAVARAMHEHGLIDTLWRDGPSDGLGAMVGAWWCAAEAARLGCPLDAVPLMQEIARYNEVDCRVMMEIVRHLRSEH